MSHWYFPGSIGTTIRRALRSFPAIWLTGPRQSGKTILLREEFGRGFAYVSLEDPDTRASSLVDPRRFLREHAPPCILDEIQHSPHLVPYIKTAIDEVRRAGRWILTGSQHFPLMKGITESLAGRAAVLELHGLSAAEIPAPRRLDTASEILHGGFPQPRLSPPADLRIWMSSYLQTYLERDVRQLAQVGDLASFEQFTRLCAARTGQLLNLAELARDAAVSATTAKRWLSILEASGQFLRVPPYFRSTTKRLVKAPKLYAMDTGLAAFLTGHRDAEVLWHGPMKGALFETLVLGEIIKHLHNAGEHPLVSHWRASAGLEVDFVIDAGGRVHGIEVKGNSTPMPHMAESLVAWRRLMGKQAGRTILACDAERRTAIARDVEAVPWREVGALCAGLFGG